MQLMPQKPLKTAIYKHKNGYAASKKGGFFMPQNTPKKYPKNTTGVQTGVQQPNKTG